MRRKRTEPQKKSRGGKILPCCLDFKRLVRKEKRKHLRYAYFRMSLLYTNELLWDNVRRLARRNDRTEERLYRESPQRDSPEHPKFANFHHNLYEHGTLRIANRHSEDEPRIPAWNKMCWIPFEGIRVPVYEDLGEQCSLYFATV
ncbi:hypothetical protein TNCV_223291 [Trichonephila clavipes]|nr:hypothetical protein TNCV_223291 [Trichonephila clavipes]